MQIAIAIVPAMLSRAAGPGTQAERQLSPELQQAIGDAQRTGLVLDRHHPASVYFISRGDRVKIGFSTNMGRRLLDLHAQAADVALLLSGGRRLEQALHERYRDFRIGNTEWFALGPALDSFIQEMSQRPAPVKEPGRRFHWSGVAARGGRVEVSTDQLLEMARRTYQPGNAGVHLSAITAALRAEGVRPTWSLAELARTYRDAGVKVRDAVRADGRTSIGIHRHDLPQ